MKILFDSKRGVQKLCFLSTSGYITERYKTETQLLWNTNTKSYVIYVTAPLLMTLSDLQVVSAIANLLNQSSETFILTKIDIEYLQLFSVDIQWYSRSYRKWIESS